MKIEHLIAHLESIAALSYQEDYDNSGILTGETGDNCTGVLVSLDCTGDVVQEAVEKKCNLIVSHHPMIFRPIRRIMPENGVGKALIQAIKTREFQFMPCIPTSIIFFPASMAQLPINWD